MPKQFEFSFSEEKKLKEVIGKTFKAGKIPAEFGDDLTLSEGKKPYSKEAEKKAYKEWKEKNN